MAGWADTKTGAHDAFLRSGKTIADLRALAPLAGWESAATGINDSGQVVGWWGFNPGSHAWLYSNGKMTDLGNFFPAAINDNGVIVGGNQVYSGGTLQNLNTLIPAGSPYQIQDATAVNDNGQIVANAYDTATYQTHALLLTPG